MKLGCTCKPVSCGGKGHDGRPLGFFLSDHLWQQHPLPSGLYGKYMATQKLTRALEPAPSLLLWLLGEQTPLQTQGNGGLG